VRYLFQVAAEKKIDIRSNAALVQATEQRNPTLVRVLMAYGISPKKEYSNPEKSPFNVAARQDDGDTLALLHAFQGLTFDFDRFREQQRKHNNNNNTAAASSILKEKPSGYGYPN